jgi:hypothetical protein
VSTVVRPIPEADLEAFQDEGNRAEAAYRFLTTGTALREGDTWNGKPVTDEPNTHFIRPQTVSFVE